MIIFHYDATDLCSDVFEEFFNVLSNERIIHDHFMVLLQDLLKIIDVVCLEKIIVEIEPCWEMLPYNKLWLELKPKPDQSGVFLSSHKLPICSAQKDTFCLQSSWYGHS